MKYFKHKLIAMFALCLIQCTVYDVIGQATNGNPANNNYNVIGYLGWANNNGVNPLLFKTNATNRMKLNGNINYSLNGYNASRNGNLLIGISNNFITSGQNIYTGSMGAFSLLHINGPGSGIQEFGYRPWMQTGITLTGNRDMSYFGLRQVGTGEDITETTITWSDNNSGSTGPDDMVFRFTGAGNGNTAISTNLTTTGDLDGLHIARFAPTGEFGLGNTFGVNANGTGELNTT